MGYPATQLFEFWKLTHRRFGWFPFLVERFGLGPDDQDMLDEWDDEYRSNMRDMERRWHRDGKHGKIAELRAQGGAWGRGRRRAYLAERLRHLVGEIAKLYESKPGPFEMAIGKDWEREADGLRDQLDMANRPFLKGGGLDEVRIERARGYPFGELLERLGVDIRRNRIQCPLHEDERPSMSISRGFGYCFSCGGSIDSIGYLMRINGLSFLDAVRDLQ